MAVLYFYVPAQKLEDVIDCGLKLSEWKDRNQATPWSDAKPCIRAFLHPMDDKRHGDPTFKCIKLDVPVEYCVVGDNDLYQLSLEHPEIHKTYMENMVPLDKYLFGSFRSPECLVFTTVLSDQLSPLGKGLGDPILYENSQTLYVNNLLERYNSCYDEINQVLLYSFLTLQKQNGCIEGLQSDEKGLAVFYNGEMSHPITVPIPDFRKYS
ncbi:MAG: hypothetical protein KBA53_08610 [Thermoclostridium sp.]|nr:hypothetical protein [Thermoclostridium sp.]